VTAFLSQLSHSFQDCAHSEEDLQSSTFPLHGVIYKLDKEITINLVPSVTEAQFDRSINCIIEVYNFYLLASEGNPDQEQSLYQVIH